MTPEDMAALHARAFTGVLRPWTAREFAAFEADPAVTIHSAAHALLVTRRAGPEVEVLTFCTDPAHRRAGLARALYGRFEEVASKSGVEEVFLEVAATNHPARALYEGLGFSPRGHRKDYYSGGGRERVHALVLSKRLRQSPG